MAVGAAGGVGAVGPAFGSAGLALVGSVDGLAGVGGAGAAGALAVSPAPGFAGGVFTCLAEAAPAIMTPAAMPIKRTLTVILQFLGCEPRYWTARVENGPPRRFVAANAEM